jgi:hypothetical protein
MPNWCSNHLTVTGDKAALDAFDAQYCTPHFSFARVTPMPEELLAHPSPVNDEALAAQMLAKYGASDWYEWAQKNWGTKWDAGNPAKGDFNVKTRTPEALDIAFDTAWSPPIPVIQKLSRLFPSPCFALHYFEPGIGFAGTFTAENGVENDDYTEDADSEQYRELAEMFGWEPEEEVA